MSTLVKYVVGHTYKPLLEKYLSKKRSYRFNGFRLEIPPEVFHPGFFFSTRFLMQQLENYSLHGKSLLELGAGSGLIAMHATGKGAIVTATDLNRTAIEYLETNSKANGVAIHIIHSDLFRELPVQLFDYIVINPPYYKKDPTNEKELAWFCGSKGEYFERLFADLGNYMHQDSTVLMVLCEGCDIKMIEEMANNKDFVLECVNSRRNIVEWDFIYNIKKRTSKQMNTLPR